jgi:DNA-directed RNA polymerase subunit RPC12/RpoP
MSKIIYMNEESDNEQNDYNYSDEEEGEYNTESYEQEQEQEQEPEEFHAKLKVLDKSDKSDKPDKSDRLRKQRSMSFDSEISDNTKRPNFKCGSCKKSFLLDKNQKMIRCPLCGYRILFKLRTHNHITYKTE